MELTKKERILVYKDGISNNAVKKYLNKYNYKYDDIVKENEYDYIVKPPGVLMNEIKVKGKIICDIINCNFFDRHCGTVFVLSALEFDVDCSAHLINQFV